MAKSLCGFCKKRLYQFFLFIVSSVVLGGGALRAQDYQFRTYTIREGLAQSRVRAVAQDGQGYLWFGTTWGGVSRFDGKNFQNFTTVEGLNDNGVTTLFCDSRGDFWAGGAKGACKFNGDRFVPFEFPQTQSLSINAIAEDAGGALWFGAETGVYCYNRKSVFRFTPDKHDVIDGPVYAIYKDAKGRLWVGGKKGLSVYNGQTFKNYLPEDGAPSVATLCMTQDKAGQIWLGTENGIFVFDGKKFHPILRNDSGKDNRINALLTDKNGVVWAATNAGLYRFENEQWTRLTVADGLPDEAILSIAEDAQGNKWLGTTLKGVCRMVITPFKLFKISEDETLKNLVWSILQDSKGRIWFGSEDGLAQYENGRLQPTPGGLVGKQIICMLEDKNGTIWFGTETGLSRYDGKRFENFSTPDKLFGELVRCMFEDRSGNLWFGTRTGVARYDGQTFQRLKSGGAPLQARVLGILEDKKGNLWFATRDAGVIRYNGAKLTYFDETQGLPNNEVSNVIQDKKGNIWLTTWGGLVKIEDGKPMRVYNVKDGLASQHVWLIEEDDKGALWLGHEKGVEKFDPVTGRFQHYGFLEGFTPIETNERAVSKDKSGNIWFGTVSGVVRYAPAFDRPNPFPPITHLTGVLLDRKRVDWKELSFEIDPYFHTPISPTLAHNQNNLIIEFIGLHYAVPEKVVYQWKLEGYDSDWTPITAVNFASYTNLTPGDYTFRLRARSGAGAWTEKPVTFSFKIRAPFWFRWWFIPIYPVAVLGLFFGIGRLRERNFQRIQARLEEVVAERTAELRSEKEIVERQNELLEDSRRHITDSLEYARRLQLAILPAKKNIQDAFPESFILYRPKDIVSGDFYWFAAEKGYFFIAAVDCTGHGVPGAFMSVLGNSLLNQLVTQEHILSPAEILNELHRRVIRTLRQFESGSGTQDGMEAALCRINLAQNELIFAGANRPLYYFRQNVLEIIKGDKTPIGGGIFGKEITFQEKRFEIQKNDTIYLFSDGYADQFGGADGKRKYTSGKLTALLTKIQNVPILHQNGRLNDEIDAWRGERKQLDDIMAIGIKFASKNRST